MSANVGAKEIVTEGLVLYLDAANYKSYTSGSTVWSDMVGKSNSGSLYNSVSYDASNGGSLVFNGLNSYVGLVAGNGTPTDTSGSVGNNMLAWTPSGSVGYNRTTIEMWFKTTDSAGRIYSKPWNANGVYNIDVRTSLFNITLNLASFNAIYRNGIAYVELADGNIHQLCIWMDEVNLGYYIDGGKYLSSKAHGLTSDSPDGGNNARYQGVIMSLFPYGEGWAGNTAFSTQGNFYLFKQYNRVLTSAEILQNYNALKGRFGLT